MKTAVLCEWATEMKTVEWAGVLWEWATEMKTAVLWEWATEMKTVYGMGCSRLKQETYKELEHLQRLGAQELCKSQGGLLGLPVPNSHCGLCGRKATLN